MNKSQRINIDVLNNNDIQINVKLEQEVNNIEFLSMSISTEDVYQNFNSDYGVLIGRVIANDGIGVPNAKISMFIPITDDDSINGDVLSVYPYKTPRDKNYEGKRYNLLPRISRKDRVTGLNTPRQPFGSFPLKEEIVINSKLLNVYKKYYKYTALTNDAGDYMIFGLPVGNRTIHMSVDITDIGKYSMNPAAMINNLGYSPNYFENDKLTIKYATDLNDLPHIETQEIDVNIIPFWGDVNNFEIGITRQDFRIRAKLQTTFVLFGTAFTDSNDTMWGRNYYSGEDEISEYYRIADPAEAYLGIGSKRIGKVAERIYYYPASISDADIDSGNVDVKQMLILDKSEYSIYKRNGDFVFIVNCNRKKIVTDVFGNNVVVGDNSPNGIFTEFRGFVTLEYDYNELPYPATGNIGDVGLDTYRYRLKFPQHAGLNQGLDAPIQNTPEPIGSDRWRKQSFKFESGKLYSFAKFHGLVANSNKDYQQQNQNGFFNFDRINQPWDDFNWNVGIILLNTTYHTNVDGFAGNGFAGNREVFGGNWLNLGIYLPQLGKAKDDTAGSSLSDVYFVHTSTHFHSQIKAPTDVSDFYDSHNRYFTQDNAQLIAATDYNTKFFPRTDLNWTDIIEVPKDDIYVLNNSTTKGIKGTKTQLSLKGNYRNGSLVPSINTGDVINQWESAIPITTTTDDKIYLYKGRDTADCINFLLELKII